MRLTPVSRAAGLRLARDRTEATLADGRVGVVARTPPLVRLPDAERRLDARTDPA